MAINREVKEIVIDFYEFSSELSSRLYDVLEHNMLRDDIIPRYEFMDNFFTPRTNITGLTISDILINSSDPELELLDEIDKEFKSEDEVYEHLNVWSKEINRGFDFVESDTFNTYVLELLSEKTGLPAVYYSREHKMNIFRMLNDLFDEYIKIYGNITGQTVYDEVNIDRFIDRVSVTTLISKRKLREYFDSRKMEIEEFHDQIDDFFYVENVVKQLQDNVGEFETTLRK